MTIIKKFSFDAAHYLPSYEGKCERLHGHTYRLTVMLEGVPDQEGMVFDFVKLKRIVTEKIIEKFDHSCLNDFLPCPSAENIAVYVWKELEPLVATGHSRLSEIEIWETKTSGCRYRGEKIS